METIKICSNHRDKEETPLIWTFAFPGAEYWCPACGKHMGMLGAEEDVKSTNKLVKRLKNYKKKSKAYLRANSALCCSYMMIKGEKRTFDSLPKQTQSYYTNKANSWKYKFNN